MTTEIRFYHLTRGGTEQFLPPLLEKIYAGGMRILVRLGSAERVAALDAMLWSHHPEGFLPHSAEKDEFTEEQPVFLTAENENPNKADVLVLADGVLPEKPEDFSICCILFNGLDEEATAAARTQWKAFRDKGFETVYFRQTETGGWEKTA
ncbi:MAG: DNA polymerase III subunit chi [Micavibrio sp.]|nr:MAG: DNA polymerase III subunit chi [Micavibrio sp.]